jgi:hypothetical protein
VPLVKSVEVTAKATGFEDAKLKISELQVKAEELKRDNPTITPQVDSARALLEARILREGIKAELSKSVTETVQVKQSLSSKLAGGLLGANQGGSGLFGSTGSGGGGILSTIVGNPELLLGATGAMGALLVEAGGLVAGLTAATVGVGAFGALALPTFDKIKNAYTGISAAQKTYNAAVALNKEDPTKANATAAATALSKLKVAQEGISGSTKAAVSGIESLVATFDKMAAAFQPTVMKVFNDGLKVANTLLPALKTPAQDAGNAIDKLLKQFEAFAKSKDFQSWLKSFDKLVGPSIAAIGHGIDLIITQIGKLITRFSARDAQHALNIFFDTIFGVITAIVKTIEWLMNSWDIASANIARTWRNIEIWFDEGAKAVIRGVQILADNVLGIFRTIIDGAAGAFGWIPGLGGKLKTAAKAFDNWDNSVYKTFSSAQDTLQKWINHLEAAPKIAKFKGDISDLQGKISAAEKLLADKKLTAPQAAKVRADISQLESQLARARADLAAINGTSATTYVNVQTVRKGGPVPLKASGGPASGLTVVGEMGPELVSVPPGSYVYSNQQSRRMLAGGGNHYTIVQNIPATVNKRDVGREVVDAIRAFEKGSGSSWRRTA